MSIRLGITRCIYGPDLYFIFSAYVNFMVYYKIIPVPKILVVYTVMSVSMVNR